jgi:PAS domain S-box-containing protein
VNARSEPQRNNAPSIWIERPRRLGAIWAICLLIYALLVPTQVVTGRAAILITDIGWTLVATAATISCIRAARASQGRDRAAWSTFATACGFWLGGQIVWDVYEIALGVPVPFPSISDVGYVAFGLLMIVGLLVLYSTQPDRRLTWLRIANLTLILFGLLIVLIAMLTQPFLRSTRPAAESLVVVAEGALIAGAFIVALYVLWSYRWGNRLTPIALMTAALAVHMMTSLFYTRELVTAEYGAMSFINLGWLLAFALQQWAAESQVATAFRPRDDHALGMRERQGWVEALAPACLVLFIASTSFAFADEITPQVVRLGAIVLSLFAIVLALREGLLHAYGTQTRTRLQRAMTELARAREQIGELSAHHRELQRDVDMTARAGMVGLWNWDLRTDAVQFSPEWKRQLGYAEDEIGNSTAEWQSRLHPDDRARVESALAKYVENPVGEFVVEERLRHRDGTYRWILTQGAMSLGSDGQPQRMMGSHVDITERKNMELSLRQSEARFRELVDTLEMRVSERTRELSEAYRESQSFAYAVAHDLKAPLRAINGFGHLLEESALPRLDASEREYIQRLRQGAIHMASLIDGLLAYSSLEHRELRFVAVDCGEVIADVLQSLDPVIHAANALVTIDIPSRQVRADIEGLRIALRNLLDNSLKFASPTRRPQIDIKGYEAAGYFVIAVRDNGIGFDPKYHDKIFEIFNRLHSSGYEGTGMGLALVRKAVQRMHGRIWAESNPGRGATFYIRLPLAE